MGLKDAWDDTFSEPVPNSEDDAWGWRSGHTWGYRSNGAKLAPGRLDKFLYMGRLETVPLSGIDHKFGRKVGRLGMGLFAGVPVSILDAIKPSSQVLDKRDVSME
jgi:hypothetical protein